MSYVIRPDRPSVQLPFVVCMLSVRPLSVVRYNLLLRYAISHMYAVKGFQLNLAQIHAI